MLRLDRLPSGQSARVIKVAGTPEFIERMHELGLVCGTLVKVLRRSPLGGTLLLRYGTNTLALRLSGKQSIYVEPLEREHVQDVVQCAAVEL